MPDVNPGQPTFLGGTPATVTNRLKSAGPEVVVRLQALDGTWETCGVDRLTRIFPENVSLSSDSWGPKTASFDLRRDPTLPWPDVLAFTPVKIEVDGQLVWSGRVSETPSREGAETVMTINCEGWQHHLDDDMLDKMWVCADPTRWKNFAEKLESDPASFPASWSVETGNGAVKMTWPADLKPYGGALVYFDAGPNGKIIKMTWKRSASAWIGNNALYVQGFNSLYNIVTSTSLGAQTAVVDNAGSVTFTQPCRYAAFRMDANSWASAATVDSWVSFKDLTVYSATALESGGSSNLKASRVVTEAATLRAPLLSTNTSMITSTSTNLAEYAPEQARTGREHINAVDGFHGWTKKVDAFRRMNYYPKPSRAKYDSGEYSLKESSDSAGSAGAEIYNRVVVTGQDAAGNPVSVTRYPQNWEDATSKLGVPNPNFTNNNVLGWVSEVPGQAQITRTTTAGEFETGVAGGKIVNTSGANGYGCIAGVFNNPQFGRAYRVTMRLKSSVANKQVGIRDLWDEGMGTTKEAIWSQGYTKVVTIGTSWTTVTYDVLPDSTQAVYGAGVKLQLKNHATEAIYIDYIKFEINSATLADRRGFLKTFNLSVNTMLPSDGVLAAAIGDAWLANHSTTSFKGDVTLSGPNSLRDRLSGQPVPLYQLLADTDELIHFSDRINPDTGGMGRTARITNVTYTPLEDKAVVTLDNTRTDFETLLNRLGAT